MLFGLLGPLSVSGEHGPIDIRGAMPRAILAMLLLESGTLVSSDRLVSELWGEEPPPSASASLRNHVARLRKCIGSCRIRTMQSGYLLHVEEGEVDVHTFAELCAEGDRAARSADWYVATERYSTALKLWRGEPLAGVPELPGLRASIDRLNEGRLLALEGRIEADLQLGRHRGVISELRSLSAEYPLREMLHRLLMLALYRAGRQAEALQLYQDLRRQLLDELGVEPCEDVKRLHAQILNADPDLAWSAYPAPSVSMRPEYSGRFQLPADNRMFTGRVNELTELLELAGRAPTGNEAGMVVVSAIDGMGGIGKTALAVHMAHRLRPRFPDGQLFLDLLGHTPGVDPLPAGEALAMLLRAMGVDPQGVPEDLGQRAAVLRHLLSGTRTLILLDNVADAAQVRALLPNEPGCLVLITSRRRLTGLDEARTLSLGVLPTADAVALLFRAAGPGRIPVDQPGLEELTELCGRLPLPIRIVGARLRHHRSVRFEDVLAGLRDEATRLALLEDKGEEGVVTRGVAAVFASSYRALTEAEQRLFRLLSLVPGPDFEACAAANLAGLALREVERLLESLLDHSLLLQHTPGRYRFHDLVRVYAASLAVPDDEADRTEALGRLLDFYECAAVTADDRLARSPRRVRSSGPMPGVMPLLEDAPGALRWLRAERENLLAALSHVTEHGAASRAVTLTAALARFLDQDGPLDQAMRLHRAAVELARTGPDRTAYAGALLDAGRVELLRGHTASAVENLGLALGEFHAQANHWGQAESLHCLGRAHFSAGDHASSRPLLEQALSAFRELGDGYGEANTLLHLGELVFLTEGQDAALNVLEHALKIYRAHGDQEGEADVMRRIARVRILNGPVMAAREPLEQALAVHRDLGHRRKEADVLWELGRMWTNAGEYAAAAEPTREAIELYRALGHRKGEGLALNLSGYIHFLVADYSQASELFERSASISAELGDKTLVALADEFRGRIVSATGDHRGGIALLRKAEAVYRANGQKRRIAYALDLQGEMHIALGEYTAAEDIYHECLELYRDTGTSAGQAGALSCIGDVRKAAGRLAEALNAYGQARDMARECGDVEQEQRALVGIIQCEEELAARGK